MIQRFKDSKIQRLICNLLICNLLIAVSLLNARTLTKTTQAARNYDKDWLDINRWRCPFYNDGRFGIDVGTRRDVAGGYWPYPLKNFYIFGAGLWVELYVREQMSRADSIHWLQSATTQIPGQPKWCHTFHENSQVMLQTEFTNILKHGMFIEAILNLISLPTLWIRY